jgi:hypothetical protein
MNEPIEKPRTSAFVMFKASSKTAVSFANWLLMMLSISKGNDLTFAQRQGVITTPDGNDMANYTIIGVGNVTQEGKPVIQGAVAYGTNSTGKLAFLNKIRNL